MKKAGVEVIAVVDQDFSDARKPERQKPVLREQSPSPVPQPDHLDLASQVKELKELLEMRHHEQPVDVLPEPLKRRTSFWQSKGYRRPSVRKRSAG